MIAINLFGKVRPGVGPQDVALAIIGNVFGDGFVKNCVLEFVGDGIYDMPIEFRNGIDVMTTETTCLSSVWMTDEKTEKYYKIHNRPEDYKKLSPENGAYYDGALNVDLSKIDSMIALPFHPSNVYSIHDLNENLCDILHKVEEDAKQTLGKKAADFSLVDKVKDGALYADQGVIAGCAGGIFDNLCAAADIIEKSGIGSFNLSVYPASQAVFLELMKNGCAQKLMSAGVTLRSAFCGPCFGAGDVPQNKGLSIRHSTRNFPNREGSKPSDGQIASVALMDARSIAATAQNGGKITAATDLDPAIFKEYEYSFDSSAYDNKVYYGFGKADKNEELRFGPNIADWPSQIPLENDILIKIASVIKDPVTTTDELIPSGETSSYRSNPEKLSEFALSRKDPLYVGRAKDIRKKEALRREKGEFDLSIFERIENLSGKKYDGKAVEIGSAVFAYKPGDGSAREQAASCQRVLGGIANIALEYATKRYRSNLINWGMIPFTVKSDPDFENGDCLFVPNIKEAIKNKDKTICAYLIGEKGDRKITLDLPELTDDERDIITCGCLINYYNKH